MLTGWKQREIAVKVLNAFERDKKLREHLEALTAALTPQERAFLRELVNGTVRFLRLLDFSVELASGRRLASQKPTVRNALRLLAYQLFFTGVPPYAALNETVEVVKQRLGKGAAGFVNAVGKKLLNFNYREEVESIKDPLERLATLHSFETWMVKRWESFYGPRELPHLLEGLNKVAPLFIRVNLIKTQPQELLNLLKRAGVEAEPHPFLKEMIRIKGRVNLPELPGFKEGLFYIQDPASYLAAYLLQPKPGELILDVGAAPGGKTTAIASLTGNGAKIVAVDVNRERAELLKENLRKLGVENTEVVITDIARDPNFLNRFRGKFDRILIDAPCSATGVIRRHPEGKWNKSLSLIKHNQTIQRSLLKAAKELLKPTGTLLYSVCSLEREEGEENSAFARRLGYTPLPLTGLPEYLKEREQEGSLRLFPHKDNADGFYYQKLTLRG
jgi:16S rRNA (cytosine967-C5)-methyltransferase